MKNPSKNRKPAQTPKSAHFGKPRSGDKPRPAGKPSPDGKPTQDRKSTKYGKPEQDRKSDQSGKPSKFRKPAQARKPPKPVEESISTDKPERIAKRMARAGLCSRREAETWINDGRVSVNGTLLTSPAMTVTLSDRIEVDEVLLPGRERTRLWLYHKPTGVLSTNRDPEGRPTLFEQLPKDLPRLLSVGRLDMNTEGLLLMTNDGGLARILELPSTGWLRRYRVRAHGKVDPEKLEGLKDGIAVDGVLYGSVEAVVDREQGRNTWLTVSIREGKNREVKNVLGAIGLEVNRLIRVSYGPFQLGDLPQRQIAEIRGRTLRDQLGERLVRESGADFNAPIYTQSGADQDKSTDKDKNSDKKPQGRQKKKTARGAIEIGTMERLGTRKQINPGMSSKSGSKQQSGKKFGKKPNRKPR